MIDGRGSAGSGKTVMICVSIVYNRIATHDVVAAILDLADGVLLACEQDRTIRGEVDRMPPRIVDAGATASGGSSARTDSVLFPPALCRTPLGSASVGARSY